MTTPQNAIRTFVLPEVAMSVDYSVIAQPAGERPIFLSAKSGDVVIVWDDPALVGSESKDWFMSQILWVEGGTRDPKVPTLFQVSDIDTGVIRWVNADQVQQIMLPFELPAEA